MDYIIKFTLPQEGQEFKHAMNGKIYKELIDKMLEFVVMQPEESVTYEELSQFVYKELADKEH